MQFGGDPKWREGVISKFVEHLGREGEKAMEQAHHEIEGALAAVAGKEGSGGLKDAAKGSDETALRVEEDKALCLGSRPAATASPALSAVSGAGCLGTPVPSLDPLEAYQLSLEVDDGPSAKRPRSANAFNPLGSNTITEGELYGVDGGKAGWESSDGESSDGESSDGEEAVRDFADLSVVSR